MVISIAFSAVLYQLSVNEVNLRLKALQHNIIDDTITPSLPFSTHLKTLPDIADALRITELETASRQMLSLLVKVNLIVLITGGFASYIMAKRTLRPIQQAHEAQGRFTSDASHELRTPLAAMKAELEVNLRDTSLTLPEARELLESNLEEVNKLISLSEMLLHLSRLEYDQLEVVTVDIPEIVTSILATHPEAKRFDLKTRKKAAVYGNEPAIREVIDILIENALKYSPVESRIAIRIFEQRGSIAFRIKNAGPAIDKHSIDRLFDRFYRGDQSRTKSSQNGYGLGLSIAKKIIDIHGGHITVSSNAKETVFTFYLPVTKNSTPRNGTSS